MHFCLLLILSLVYLHSDAQSLGAYVRQTHVALQLELHRGPTLDLYYLEDLVVCAQNAVKMLI